MTPERKPFRELSDQEYAAFRRDLLRDKGSTRQRDFLEVVRRDEAFLNHMSFISTTGSLETALAPEPMTESEFKDPPSGTEQRLHGAWSALPPAVACRTTFWAHVTIAHIRAGRMHSVFLAANGGTLAGGAERIDLALGQKEPTPVDACVRTILRRLGGLREVRGNRSVYVDCPFARAWWRERMVEQVALDAPDIAPAVRRVLHISQTYWEKFVDRIVFRNSTFGAENIRSAFLRVLVRFIEGDDQDTLKSTKELQRACRRATALQGVRELSILTDYELDALLAPALRPSA